MTVGFSLMITSMSVSRGYLEQLPNEAGCNETCYNNGANPRKEIATPIHFCKECHPNDQVAGQNDYISRLG
ncbi:Uncharacterized protein HZ326_12271 [Fusarium oxysporum f. sp. albedinis]|nr:Uncharacterized protein HZ326_12271 [Fusarium oxysporum f. sp. albedinis]